ncbi:cation diffusion facilitator family transporter [Leptolyngbya sp. PCC 6406]|uniref:cation diffusion facilitator family transporter n=1 Tax=Leptolyngbya sp. PCC 6406 TaxID=1173264 RepID=UPI0002AC2D05|nr:cation diffusion facilitator family transporter [Leptolyngbya sp. PCC 6406]
MVEGIPHRRISYRLLLTTLWVTLLVVGVEAIAAWTSQSLLLLAEALHTLIDAFGTGLSLVAVAAPQRPLGREVLGHGRTEVVGSLLMVAFLGFTGISLLLAALQQGMAAVNQRSPAFPVTMDRPVLYLIGSLMVCSLGLALYVHYRSRSLGSLSLALNARHLLTDGWLSGVTLAGLVAIWQDQTWVDPLLAAILTVLAVRSLWRVLNSHVPMLLRPMAIAPEAIAHIATQVEGVTRCIRIRSRGLVGRQVWVELHLAVHPEFLGVAHLVGERVDAALRHQYGPIRTQIWVEESQPPPSAYLERPDTPWPQTPSPETDWL